ncbi:hypothetical protein PIB30_047073 [Stylosanthes scabra]|uniref:ER membrane protein complex subunit 4 n=1 Tax=Stylosanthes scabra TaxID=79078 RepID=A0ABU6VEK1_9FABA|nr:hypothetical protein [Stylosanthes scabra]
MAPLNSVRAMENMYFSPEILAFATPSRASANAETMQAPKNFTVSLSVKGMRMMKESNGVEPNNMKDVNVTRPFFHGVTSWSAGSIPLSAIILWSTMMSLYFVNMFTTLLSQCNKCSLVFKNKI